LHPFEPQRSAYVPCEHLLCNRQRGHESVQDEIRCVHSGDSRAIFPRDNPCRVSTHLPRYALTGAVAVEPDTGDESVCCPVPVYRAFAVRLQMRACGVRWLVEAEALDFVESGGHATERCATRAVCAQRRRQFEIGGHSSTPSFRPMSQNDEASGRSTRRPLVDATIIEPSIRGNRRDCPA